MEFELRNTNYTDLNRRLKGWTKVRVHDRSAWNMFKGDMWDYGLGYIGPMPNIDDSDKDKVLHLILKAFTSRNVVRETVNRAIDGLISRSPNWTVYDQNSLISRAIEDAKKRTQAQQQVTSAHQNISDIAQQDKFVPPTPDPQKAQDINAENVNGSIKLTVRNDQGGSSESDISNQKEIEAEIILGRLWTELNIKEIMRDAFSERLVTGRGCMRVYIPKKFLNPDGSVKPVDGFLNAIKAVRAEHVPRDRAKVIENEGDKISVVRLEKSKGERSSVQTMKGIEISFVNDDDGKTYLAVFEPENQKNARNKDNAPPPGLDNEDQVDVSEVIADLEKNADIGGGIFLDGNLFTEEICGDPFVTPQLLQNNRALNLDLTLAVNVLIEDGFTEMVTTNAAIKTVEVPDPNNPGKTIHKAVNLKRGPSMSTNLVGVAGYDAQGNKTYESPGVEFRNPTPLDAFDQGEQLYYRQCLSETKQIFVLISADSLASGESRIQARQDFLTEILNYKSDTDKIGGWVMTTLLHLVAALAGKDGYFKGIGVTFDARVSAGELSADEKNVVISRYDKGLISRENAMVLLGSEDPLLEIDQIRADQAEQMQLQIQRVSAMSQFSQQIQSDKAANPENNPKNDKQPGRVQKGQPPKK